jgi:phenol phosphorylase subunit delta gamma
MKVGNWMTPNPITVEGDILLSDAKRMLAENNLHAIPVVEDGRLRGLITRANCMRAAQFVSRTQGANEFEYFSKRLKVKDLMVRRPATVNIDDTMESTLHKGQDLRVGQFPVLDGDQVVGIISASEVFKLTAHLLGAWEHWGGISIGPMDVGPETLRRIAEIIEEHDAIIYSLFAVIDGDKKPNRVVVRLETNDLDEIAANLQRQGFNVMESCVEVQRYSNDKTMTSDT